MIDRRQFIVAGLWGGIPCRDCEKSCREMVAHSGAARQR
jgi:hypothetical protein